MSKQRCNLIIIKMEVLAMNDIRFDVSITPHVAIVLDVAQVPQHTGTVNGSLNFPIETQTNRPTVQSYMQKFTIEPKSLELTPAWFFSMFWKIADANAEALVNLLSQEIVDHCQTNEKDFIPEINLILKWLGVELYKASSISEIATLHGTLESLFSSSDTIWRLFLVIDECTRVQMVKGRALLLHENLPKNAPAPVDRNITTTVGSLPYPVQVPHQPRPPMPPSGNMTRPAFYATAHAPAFQAPVQGSHIIPSRPHPLASVVNYPHIQYTGYIPHQHIQGSMPSHQQTQYAEHRNAVPHVLQDPRMQPQKLDPELTKSLREQTLKRKAWVTIEQPESKVDWYPNLFLGKASAGAARDFNAEPFILRIKLPENIAINDVNTKFSVELHKIADVDVGKKIADINFSVNNRLLQFDPQKLSYEISDDNFVRLNIAKQTFTSTIDGVGKSICNRCDGITKEGDGIKKHLRMLWIVMDCQNESRIFRYKAQTIALSSTAFQVALDVYRKEPDRINWLYKYLDSLASEAQCQLRPIKAPLETQNFAVDHENNDLKRSQDRAPSTEEPPHKRLKTELPDQTIEIDNDEATAYSQG
jgi:hypothetical protein